MPHIHRNVYLYTYVTCSVSVFNDPVFEGYTILDALCYKKILDFVSCKIYVKSSEVPADEN
jgi:hypothetical protein